jgi:hypothetical protein
MGGAIFFAAPPAFHKRRESEAWFSHKYEACLR